MKNYIEALKEIKKESKDFKITLSRKEVLEITKEFDRLNNIINEAINYTTKQIKKYEGYDRDFEIVLSNIVVMLGSDK